MTRAALYVFLPLVAAAADITGSWNLTVVRFSKVTSAGRVELKTEGTKLTGTLNAKLEGTSENDTVKITAIAAERGAVRERSKAG